MNDGASAALSVNIAGRDPLIGRTINGRFKITGLVARGGMGTVYRAEQAPLGRICAVKVLKQSDAGTQDPDFSKRFSREASIVSKLTHPNTVTIFDYGCTEDDVYYMAMEYLVGQTLRRAIRKAGFFAQDRAIHIARQICRALSEAHSFGVIHRDLKPANIFLVEHGDEVDFVKVLDFGLVKRVSETKGEELTRAGFSMGSPKYMAPERVRGDRVDARTDIYSLGIIMYEMIAGKAPFDGSSNNVLMAQVQQEPLPLRQVNPKARVSTALEEIIAKSMAKDPRLRFDSMDDLLGALKHVPDLRSRPVTPRDGPRWPPLGPPPRSRSRSRHRKTATSRFRALVSVLAVASAVVGLSALRASRVAAPAPSRLAGVTGTDVTSAAHATASVGATTEVARVVAVKVRIKTDPSGATVKENGVEICATTPCDVVYAGADADPLREHRLTLIRQSYRADSRVVRVGDSPVVVKLFRAADNLRADPSPR